VKFVVSYVVVDDNDRVERLESVEDYDFELTDHNLSAIQRVVDGFEANDLCIDQGGDDSEYEFNLADGAMLADESEVRDQAEQLLREIESIFADE
jgi:hypothetical protein